MTCYETGTLNGPEGLLTATLIGLAFGFWLERAGFGSSRKLTAIFYLRDFAVLKVMFTAIATAAVGIAVLSAFGAVELNAIYRPATYLWPQIVGGLLFGAGFVVGGYCPGTSLVGLASGKLDAAFFFIGALAGSLLFAAAYPALANFAVSGAHGVSSLSELLGLSRGALAVLVAIVALGAFLAAERIERRFSKHARSKEV